MKNSNGMTAPEYTIQRDIISEGFDGKMEWWDARVGIMPPNKAVLLMLRSDVDTSDVARATYSMRSDDFGRNWSQPMAQPNLAPVPIQEGRFLQMPWDLVPAWHAATKKLLALGHTNAFVVGGKTPAFGSDAPCTFPCYCVYDAKCAEWGTWDVLDLPDENRFYRTAGGAAQRVDLPNGDILWPIYYLKREAVNQDSPWHNGAYYSAAVLRCRFDGQTLKVIEYGDELTLAEPRGFCEPSLTQYDGTFYLTLRNDVRGYVATSPDGLHFDPPTPWTFDDGEDLGSYNTQQHWVTHSEGLFLVYTRRGADNDQVIRHRAPLFMAQVDPVRRCVIRATERILLPNKGAQFGNFGVVNVSPQETWVVDTEGMLGDVENPHDVERTVRRGANNRVYLCRLIWNKPNRLVK